MGAQSSIVEPPSSPRPARVEKAFIPAPQSNQYLVGCTCCKPTAEVQSSIVKQITTGFGRTIEVNVGKDPDGTERLYLAHEPPNLRSLVRNGAKLPLLFYCHGKQGSAWDSALDETQWRLKSKQGFFVVFGQARGSIFVHPTRAPGDEFGLGGTFWQSIYPTDDINYVSNVLESVMNLFPNMIDPSRLFFMGFSSGGLFSYPLSILLGHRFAAIVNYMGGVQNDSIDAGALPSLNESTGRPPIYIITGEHDSHKSRCEEAKKLLLESAGYPVSYRVLPGKAHEYHTNDVEPLALEFFMSHARMEQQQAGVSSIDEKKQISDNEKDPHQK